MARDENDLADELTDMMVKSGYWFDAIPDDGKRALEVVKERWRSGLLGTRVWRVARMIIELGTSRGWRMPSPHPIVTWLRHS